jgi:hypothetical protein
MTVCRSSWLAGVCLALTAGAQAQDAPASPPAAATAAPQALPGKIDATTPAPPASGAAPASPPSDESPPPATETAPTEFKPGMLGQGTQPGVTASDLGIVDGAPVGTLNDSNGGLGQGMWAAASRTDVEDLLGSIPLVSADPFEQKLARRVVLTTSDSPIGPAKRALVTIRIEKLLQAGMVPEAGTIAAALSLKGDMDFARVQADALLYAGRDKDVCSDMTATRATATDAYWLQLRLWCFVASSDFASAELTHAVLDAQGATDRAFDVLVADATSGKKTPPGDTAQPTALHIYLLRKLGLPVSAAIAAKLGTAAAAMAARDKRNPPADRLSAATRISQTGALSPAEIDAILNAQTIRADQIAHVDEVASKLPFLPAQSLLRRAAKLEPRLNQKAVLVVGALSADNHPDRLTLTAELQSDLALAIPPGPALATERGIIARALVLSGHADAAELWYTSAADDADVRIFRILIDLAAPNARRDAAAQAALETLATVSSPQQAPSEGVALALGLSDVLGKPIQPDAKALAATLEGTRWDNPARRPSAEDMRKLEEAASQPGRKGEVVLRVLEIVGANGPFGLPADVTIECVRVLGQVGLSDDARTLAIEALALQPPQP